ncbi:MAG: hypothetical protein V4447_10595 [Pseudomonadota bacterium]
MKRTPVTQDHEQIETNVTEVIEPGHDPRGQASPLFHKTRLLLIERERGMCWLSGLTSKELGPLEAHHMHIERCFAEAIDWARFSKAAMGGKFGPYAQAFDWTDFFVGCETVTREDTGLPYLKVRDPYLFVDNMLVNGILLGKKYHIGKDEGIHQMPHPFWQVQGFLAEGYKFSQFEVIHHAQDV